MIPVLFDAAFPFAAAVAAKATLLVGAAALAHAVARRYGSAATRHLIWSLAMACLLLLPPLSATLPGWGIPVAGSRQTPVTTLAPSIAPEAKPADAADRTARVEAPGTSDRPAQQIEASAPRSARPLVRGWASAALVAYAGGVLLLLARIVAHRRVIRRIRRSAEPVADRDWTELLLSSSRKVGVQRNVLLLRSPMAIMPMTCGTRCPAVVIPAMAGAWPERRRRAVLLHEMAHVARYDCLTQTLAALACALYWFHPGVWWAARCLQVEQERACDDLVLSAGTRAQEYAGHLLQIAHKLHGRAAAALAVSIARRSELEGRMLAILDGTRRRTAPGSRARLAAALAAVVLLIPVAGARAVPRQTPEPVRPRAVQGLASGLHGVNSTGRAAAAGERGRPRIAVTDRTRDASVVAVQTRAASAQPTARQSESAGPAGTAGPVHPGTDAAGQSGRSFAPVLPESATVQPVVFTRDGTLELALEANSITLRYTEAGLRTIGQDLRTQRATRGEPALGFHSFSSATAVESVGAMKMEFPLSSIRDVEYRTDALILRTVAWDGTERSQSGSKRGEIVVEQVVPGQAERFVDAFRRARHDGRPSPTAGAEVP